MYSHIQYLFFWTKFFFSHDWYSKGCILSSQKLLVLLLLKLNPQTNFKALPKSPKPLPNWILCPISESSWRVLQIQTFPNPHMGSSSGTKRDIFSWTKKRKKKKKIATTQKEASLINSSFKKKQKTAQWSLLQFKINVLLWMWAAQMMQFDETLVSEVYIRIMLIMVVKIQSKKLRLCT